MAYLLELRQGDDSIAQEIEDKDTLWYIVEAMIDGNVGEPIDCVISKVRKPPYVTMSVDDIIWEGKEEERHDTV